jgi:hypothetical protein
MQRLGPARLIGGIAICLVFAVGLAGINFGRADEPGHMSQKTCSDYGPQHTWPRDSLGNLTCSHPEDLGMWSWPPEHVVGWVLVAIGFIVLYFVTIKPLVEKDEVVVTKLLHGPDEYGGRRP